MFHIDRPLWPPTALLRPVQQSSNQDRGSHSSKCSSSSKKNSTRRCVRKQATQRCATGDESKSSQNSSKPTLKSSATQTTPPASLDRQGTVTSKLSILRRSKTDAHVGSGSGKRDKKKGAKKARHRCSQHKRSLSQPVVADEEAPIAMVEEESKEAPQEFRWNFPISRSEDGHACVSLSEKEAAEQQKNSLLFGEILPSGASKLFDSKHLDLANAKVVYDLGMGCGKVALQGFIEYENLDYVLGVELCASRFDIARTNLWSYEQSDPEHVKRPPPPATPTNTRKSDSRKADRRFAAVAAVEHTSMVYPTPRLRSLEFACGDLFEVQNLHKADVVLLITQFPTDCYVKVLMFLTKVKPNAKLATYLDIGSMYAQFEIPCPFAQLETNHCKSDRFFASWATKTGAHFFLWRRLTAAEEQARAADAAKALACTNTAEENAAQPSKQAASDAASAAPTPSRREKRRVASSGDSDSNKMDIVSKTDEQQKHTGSCRSQ